MQALADIAFVDAELRPTIIIQLERLTRTGSPAMQSRGRKLLAQLAVQAAVLNDRAFRFRNRVYLVFLL